MIFKSKQVNLDPEPWQCYNIVTRDGGKTFERAEFLRHAEEHEGDVGYEPRPEFEPTRDPLPFDGNTATPEHPDDNRFDWEQGMELIENGMALEWAPRREQFDTPVNRALVHFRQMHGFKSGELLKQAALAWCASLMSMSIAGSYTIHEARHANKVLKRIARWKDN